MKRLMFLLLLATTNQASAVGDDFMGLSSIQFADDFQHHSGNSPLDIWNTTVPPASNFIHIINYPPAYSQALAMDITAYVALLREPLTSPSNYWAYTAFYTGSFTCNNYAPILLNATGVTLATLNPGAGRTCYSGLYEIVVSGGTASLYYNGSLYASAAIAESPSNIKLDLANAAERYDDIHTTTGIVGMASQFTEADNDIQVSYAPYIKYAYPSSTYSVDVVSLSNGQVHNTTTVTNYSGFVVWDRQSTLGYSYDVYRARLLKDGIQEAYHDFFYVPSAIYGTINFTSDTYMQGDSMNFTYELFTPAFATYEYRAVLTTTSGTVEQTVMLSSDLTGSSSFDSSGLSQGTYYGLLQRKCVAGCIDWELLSYDIAGLDEGFNVHGYTYDAMNGTVLGNVSVNISQSDGTWFNTTSNATTGYYNLSGLLTISTTFNASIANFTMDDFTVTPTFPGTKVVDLYLWPTNLTHSNTTIQGLTQSYPYHQVVASASVYVYNATDTLTATSNSWGYYRIDTNDSTYSVNATKSGYRDSSVYSVTPALNEWKVQNIILYPLYDITIRAKDSVTSAYISSFSTEINGVLYQTTNGSVTVQLEYGTYTISTSATGYSGSTGSINVEADATETILLTPFSTTTSSNTVVKILPHDVKFIVQDVFGHTYSGITVTVQGYNTTVGSWGILSSLLGMDFNTTPINSEVMTGITGADGAVVFKMSEVIYYHVTTTGTTPIISSWLYPKDDLYYLVVSATDTTWNDFSTPMSTGIVTNVTKATINASSAWINVSYNDSLSQTTSLIVYVNQSNSTTGNLNQTMIQSWTCPSGCNSTNHSFTISPYDGQSYIVNIRFVHSTYGTNVKSYAVVFPKTVSATGIPQIAFLMAAILIMVFVGAVFTYSTSEIGLIVVCGVGWIFWLIGWFNASDPSKIGIGLTLATFVAIIAYMAKQSEKGRYT